MKTKTLIPATIIALALIAAACGSGSDSDNVSTFNPAPEATVSVETVPETTEELRERVPTTEVPVVTEREVTEGTDVPTPTVPDGDVTTTTEEADTATPITVRAGDIDIVPFDYESLPEGINIYEDGLRPEDTTIQPPPIGTQTVSRTSEGLTKAIYDLDFSLLPEFINFKIVNGEKLVYSKELDTYTTCGDALFTVTVFNEYGYCTSTADGVTSSPAIFIDNEGNYISFGLVFPPEDTAEERKAVEDFARELTGGHRGG